MTRDCASSTSDAFFVGVVEVLQFFEEQLEVFFFEGDVAHGDEGCAGGLGGFDEVFPAVGIDFVFPHDGGHVVANVAGKAAHAVAFDESDHVVFEQEEIVWLHHQSLIVSETAGGKRGSFVDCRIVVWRK